jgi:RNA methyltransferase, TrmH family
MQSIESIKDSRVIHARSLAAAVGRRRAQECLLFGAHQIAWALEAGLQIDHVFVVLRCEHDELVDSLEAKGIPVLEVSSGIIKKITATNFIIPIVGIAHLHAGSTRELPQEKLLLVFDRVIQYKNAGAMVRNAQLFGVRNVVIADETGGDVFYRRLIEGSHGAVFSSSIHSFESPKYAVSALKQKGYRILVSAPGVKARGSVFDIQHSPVALVVSADWAGVREDFIEAADVVLPEPVMPWSLEHAVQEQDDIESLAVLKLRMVLALLSEQLNKKIMQHPGYSGFMLVQAFQRELAKVAELSLPHVFVLMQLIADRIVSFDSIAKQYLCQPGAVSEFVQLLVVRGLVERFGHQKFEGVRITLRGEQMLERCWLVVEYVQAMLYKDFSEQERVQLAGFLERLSKNSRML